MSGSEKLNLDANYLDGSGGLGTGGLLNVGIFGSNIYTILFSLILISSSIYLIFYLSKKNFINFERSLFIFSFHSIISGFFVIGLMIFLVNDIDSYYQEGLFYMDQHWEKFEGGPNYNFRHWGILSMAKIYRIFTYYFHLDFLSINLLFASVGSFMLILYDRLILQNIYISKFKDDPISYIFLFLVFFPSLSLWTGYLGKEILTFSLLITAAYIVIKVENNSFIVAFFIPLILLSLIIRPHFAVFFSFSLFIFLLFRLIKNNWLRSFFIISSVFVFAIFGTLLLGDTSGLSLNIFENLNNFSQTGLEMRQNFVHNSKWDILKEDNSLILYIKFLFTPIINLEGPKNILVSIENILLIIIMLAMIINVDKKKLTEPKAMFFLIFFAVSSFVMSQFSYNEGIYWRQKWLLLPYFFIGMSLIQKKHLDVKK